MFRWSGSQQQEQQRLLPLGARHAAAVSESLARDLKNYEAAPAGKCPKEARGGGSLASQPQINVVVLFTWKRHKKTLHPHPPDFPQCNHVWPWHAEISFSNLAFSTTSTTERELRIRIALDAFIAAREGHIMSFNMYQYVVYIIYYNVICYKLLYFIVVSYYTYCTNSMSHCM